MPEARWIERVNEYFRPVTAVITGDPVRVSGSWAGKAQRKYASPSQLTIPAVAQVISRGGLDIAPSVTFLVGEKGSDKSTLVEALADAYVYHRKGHLTPFARTTGPASSREDSELSNHLRARVHRMASPAGFFLRAESMHGFLSEVDASPSEARAWGEGETLFDILVDIIRVHGAGGDEADDGVELVLA